MTHYIDTNVVVRHLAGDPPEQARRATRFLHEQPRLFLADLIVAEVAYVLESFYEAPRAQIAQLLRSAVALPTMDTRNPALLLRTLQIYEDHNLAFADSYVVATAEMTGDGPVLSFDKGIDKVGTVERAEP